jgi:tripartite ATP-independent transporter DctM subunit
MLTMIAPETAGWIGIAVMLFMVGIGVPVAYAMGIVGFVGSLLLLGVDATHGLMEIVPFGTVASYSFGIVPLFVIMGYLVFHAGFANGAFETARAWLGHRTGGVPMASVVGCAIFGAASGSGLASTATLARITIPEMIASGVEKKLAYGVVAAAGPLAQMIPPSVLMIIYAIIAEQPAGKMLIAGIVPGLLIVMVYLATIYIRVRMKPSLAPSLPRVPWPERMASLRKTWGIAALAVFVIGGIYSGIFTPTEAGAVGATWALFLTIIARKLTWPVLRESIHETIRTTSMVFLIVIGAFIFGQFLSITRLPTSISAWITGLPVAPIVVIIGIVIFYLILGLFIDMVAAMFITLPILLPAVVQLGYDPIWFGVLVVFLAEIALATPPFGLGLFIINGVIQESTLAEVAVGVLPFIVADFVILAILVAWPQLILFLPNLM